MPALLCCRSTGAAVCPAAPASTPPLLSHPANTLERSSKHRSRLIPWPPSPLFSSLTSPEEDSLQVERAALQETAVAVWYPNASNNVKVMASLKGMEGLLKETVQKIAVCLCEL